MYSILWISAVYFRSCCWCWSQSCVADVQVCHFAVFWCWPGRCWSVGVKVDGDELVVAIVELVIIDLVVAIPQFDLQLLDVLSMLCSLSNVLQIMLRLMLLLSGSKYFCTDVACAFCDGSSWTINVDVELGVWSGCSSCWSDVGCLKDLQLIKAKSGLGL